MIRDSSYQRDFYKYQKEVEALKQQISQCATGPWEPIADAPRDGTEVLLKDKDNIVYFGMTNEGDPSWSTDSGVRPDGYFTYFARIKGE
jgi:hypothetical protein